jgi:TnpA family transposase
MSTDQRPDRTAKALREYGRLIESNFVLRWSGDPDMRQRSHGQLNKGESANSLRREVGYGNRGRVRAQDPEQLHRHMEARRLVANAIGYWNARYIALSFKVVGAASGHAGVVKMGEDAGAALLTPRLCLVPC